MEFSTERTIKSTRKEHTCFWCDEKITVGSPSVYMAGKWDGDFNHFYLHPECNEASAEYAKIYGYDPDDYPEFGTMKRGSIEPKEE